MRLLFVSKPVMPPWNDGSKNLVRDLASHLTRVEPTVMVAPGAPSLGPRVVREPVYGLAGRFAPGANTLVMNRLLFGPPLDAWAFVFAPNVASSSAARIAIAAQRARGWKGKVVQIVASRPKEMSSVRSLLFGDRIVALSAWTRDRLIENGVSADRVVVIPPCAAAPPERTADDVAAFRGIQELGDGPILLYPGDLEFSTGARTVARAAPEILRRVPGARIVFACRPKTPRAAGALAELRQSLAPVAEFVTFLGEVPDMAVVLAAADVVLFPVDDLYGKVDLPLVLLEALALRKHVIVADGGPLPELGAVTVIPPRDPQALADAACRVLDPDVLEHPQVGGQGIRAAWHDRYRPQAAAAAFEALFDA
jgi:phosphatidylinositol alpha-1,6-mannosyltransferase